MERRCWYFVDTDGFLLSQVYLYPAEYDVRTDKERLVADPPSGTVGASQRWQWDGTNWAAATKYPTKDEARAKVKALRATAFAARAVSSAGVAYSITADKANLAERLASLQAAVAIGLASPATTIEWRDRDNLAHTLDLTGLRLLAAEMGVRGQAIYQRSWTLDAQVQAAPSNAALAEINLEAGWP